MIADSPDATRGPAAGARSLLQALRRRTRHRLASRIARVAPPGAILDVASADALLHDALRGTGRLVARSSADITQLGGRYAAIVFWRAGTPDTALEHAAALLKPGGLLAVAQPAGTARVVGERLSALGLHVERPPRLRGWLPGVVTVEARR